MTAEPSMDEIDTILKHNMSIAIVGMSPKEDSASRRVSKYLIKVGYKVFPVNPKYTDIFGIKSYSSILDIPDKIDIVDIFRKSEEVIKIVEDAIKKGVKVVWMQEGIVNDVAAKKALDAGIKVVMNKCMMKEHRRISRA